MYRYQDRFLVLSDLFAFYYFFFYFKHIQIASANTLAYQLQTFHKYCANALTHSHWLSLTLSSQFSSLCCVCAKFYVDFSPGFSQAVAFLLWQLHQKYKQKSFYRQVNRELQREKNVWDIVKVRESIFNSCAEHINCSSRLAHWKCLKFSHILCSNILGLHCARTILEMSF